MAIRLYVSLSACTVVGTCGHLLAALGIAATILTGGIAQAVEESRIDEELKSARFRAESAYNNADLKTARREIDEALSLLPGQRSVENAILEYKLQRLRGDIARILDLVRIMDEDAEEYYRNALKALGRAEGQYIERRVETQNALATLLVEKGRTDAAINLAEKSIEEIRAVFGDDANKQYFLSSYRTIAIAYLVDATASSICLGVTEASSTCFDVNFDKALSAQALAIDAMGEPRVVLGADITAMDKLWYATIQLEAGEFESALNGFGDTYLKLGQGSQDQCHALAGILIIAQNARAGETALVARNMLQSQLTDIEMKAYLAACLAKGARWTMRDGFWHHRFWFARMREKLQ